MEKWLDAFLNSKWSQYGALSVLVVGFLRYGERILTFTLERLGITAERRWSVESLLRQEIDGMKDDIARLDIKYSRIGNAYTFMQGKLAADAVAIEKELDRLGIQNPLIIYILESWKLLPTLSDIDEAPVTVERHAEARAAAEASRDAIEAYFKDLQERKKAEKAAEGD